MSKKPSHIPLFPDAYLRDNFRMSLEQHGMFLMLIMEAWNDDNCSLPDDEKELAALCGVSVSHFRKIASPVLSKWTRENGRIYQKRLRKEWLYVREKSAKAKASVAQRKDRAGGYERTYERTTNDLHLGGGGGVGVDNHYQDKRTEGDSAREELNRFVRVIDGGAK